MCRAERCDGLAAGPTKAATAASWRRFFAQPVKPKLSRKVVGGARVNLNRYWSKFEEMTSLQSFSSASVMVAHGDEHTGDNEINDNIANENKENGKTKQ